MSPPPRNQQTPGWRPVHVSRRDVQAVQPQPPATGRQRAQQARLAAPPIPGSSLVAVVRAGTVRVHGSSPLPLSLPFDFAQGPERENNGLCNPLVIATLLTDHKAYVLPEVLAALWRLRWDGDKVLFVTYNGEHRQCRRLVARHWPGPVASLEVEVALSRDNGWHSGQVALLREETRRGLLRLDLPGSHVLWIDCDVVVPEHAAEALAAHGQALLSGVVPSRAQNAVIARDAFGAGLIAPGHIRTEGLRPIAMAGFGCLLMERRVLSQIHWLPEELAGIVDGRGGEDDHACAEAAELGHQVYLDPEVLCTHYAEGRAGNAAAAGPGGKTLDTFMMAPQPYAALPVAERGQGKPRRVLWPLTSPGCFGGIKVALKMMRAMHEAGWEVTACSRMAWQEAGWADWSFVRRVSERGLEPPYDLVVATHHATLPFGARVPATQHMALIQADEPQWNPEDTVARENFCTPGYRHVIIANHMREYATKYGHDIAGQIDNGVDTLTFYPDWMWWRKWPRRFMFVRKSGPHEYTGEHLVAEAVGELVRRYPDLEVLVVGHERPPQWPCKVQHLQTSDEAEMRRAYNSVSCLVRASRVEGFPLIDLEAMACGTPLVATPIGIDDLVVDGESALLIEQGSVSAIVAAVSRIFDEPALRERLSRNGLRLARERTWEREQQQWLEIVGRVMGGDK